MIISTDTAVPTHLCRKQKQIVVTVGMVELAPGTNLLAEIKTWKRRVTEFVLSRMQKAIDRSCAGLN